MAADTDTWTIKKQPDIRFRFVLVYQDRSLALNNWPKDFGSKQK